jgi:hypothetical protein
VAGVNRSRSPKEPASAQAPVVHSITAAAQSHSEDMDTRIRRYLISMAIRTVCVILVLVIDNPIRWVFAALAIVLPYVAVVMANAAGSRRRPPVPAVPVVPVIRVPLDVSRDAPLNVPLDVPLDQSGPTVETPLKSDLISDASSERTN